MTMIHVARGHQPHGVFNEEEFRAAVATGQLAADDLVWKEGMSEWKPLGEMASQWGLEISPSGTMPEARPLPELSLPVSSLPETGAEPAWEDREHLGTATAIIRTVGAVLMRPAATFAAMRRTGGLSGPLLYFVLLSSIMFAVSVFYQMVAISQNPEALNFLKLVFPTASKSTVMVSLIGQVLLSPVRYLFSAFLVAGCTHLCLKLIGGANQPFETTFRVLCYAQASAAVFSLLPLLGGLLGVIWSAYSIIIGLREAQQTTGMKATIAITLPGVVCLVGLILLGMVSGISLADLSGLSSH